MHNLFNLVIMGFLILKILSEKIDLDTSDSYSKFLSFGDKKLNKLIKNQLENDIIKSKIDVMGRTFKKNINMLKASIKLDIVFLIDASSSVGEKNFKSELKFVKKILSDVTVDFNHTRVAVVTFSSPSNIVTNVDEISHSSKEQNKCLLLNRELKNIHYSGGETFTIGAFQTAKEVFDKAFRNDSKKVLFLITDGYSSGGDPVPLAEELKNNQVMIFTIGIENGNYNELYKLSSSPGEHHSYLLDSFTEFESLARRALHVDLKSGDYIPIGKNQPCDMLCPEGNCCDAKAICTCGTTTGHYACICQPGYYGSGLKNSCLPCTPGTYSAGPNLCLPCPDVHHTTTGEAYGIESCKCKEGYQTTKNGECKVLKCPKVSIPKNGYFVKKKECTNIFNSACGVRCEVGYTLVGSSIRVCQLDATWSGIEPTCEVKTCSQLSVPKSGRIKCKHPDLNVEYDRKQKVLPVDTVCSFECEKRKLLIGSRKRTCLPLSTWDGLKTTCKAIKCNKLPQIRFGKMEPNSCNFGKQEYGKTCNISCKDGFEILGPTEKRCTGRHGTWDSKFEDTSCIDILPPKLECPDNITTNTLSGKKYGQVVWKIPNVTDNSGLEVLVWVKPAIKNVSDFKFQIGETPITYYAQDAFYNIAQCTFFVSVQDNEAPVIENCLDPPPFLTNNLNGADVSWEEPYVYDNSQEVKMTKSHEFGYFKIGMTTVTYTAVDGSANKNICKITITVEGTYCEFLPDPSFGKSTCTEKGGGVNCVITCQEGYVIPIAETNPTIGDTSNFICNNTNPVWYNEDGVIFPECSVTSFPEESIQDGEVSITPEVNVCNDTKKLEELKNYVESTLNNEICIENCTIDTESECEAELMEEKFNKIVRRRDVTFEEVPHRNKNKVRKKKINVKFQVRAKYINETCNDSKFIKTHGYNFTIRYNKIRIVCPVGFVPRKNRCVQCPRGTFQNNTSDKCQSCPFGYYNNKLGQTECTSCALHYSTKKLHSKKADDCKGECSPGTHAQKRYLKYSKHHPDVKVERTTLKPQCYLCDVGYYQTKYGALACTPCPKGYTTSRVGSTSFKQCIPTALHICSLNVTCNHGSCIVSNDYEYTCSCSENYVGTNCDKFISGCMSEPCLNGGTCLYLNGVYMCVCTEGFTGKYCEEEIFKCGIECLNNGTCAETEANEIICLCPPGYGGELCEISIKYCSAHTCENNGTCIEDEGTFKCQCSKGFIGKRCNILPCDYKPCTEFTICINDIKENATKEDYSCVCPEGYSGKECKTKLNHCQSAPCLNGGSCNDNLLTYSCTCHNLYFGFNCQYKRNTNYVLHFQRYDTNDYVKLNGFVGNITEITACLWMQTSDSFNYGTLLSYATRYTDNAFTLTDYTGLVLYINNNHVVTDVLLNDGHWHHVCTTWQSQEGLYKVYLDGNVIKNGTGLSTDTHIQGSGNLIIGQEQDILGGKFSLSESFIGKISYVDIWSRTLQDEEILNHFNDCNDSFFGNLYPWPEMQEFIKGGVQIINSTFCNKCEHPSALFNGAVKVVDNIAHYSCEAGFELNIKKYVKGRKCTKATNWEGFYEPYCKKVFCGYPGFVRNGYQIGYSYYYQDRVVYNCHIGFNMKGNSTIICGKDGKWFPEKPQCLGPQCVAFKKPPHSQINIIAEQNYKDFVENQTKFDMGTQIEISCSSDADIYGENIITCTENGTWDYEPPECNLKEQQTTPKSKTLDCSENQIPAAPVNGYIDLNSLYNAGNGTTNFIVYKCRPGYKLYGDNITTCIIDGYWTQPNTSCRATMCLVPRVSKYMELKERTLVGDAYYVGDALSFQCEGGYSMFGNGIIRCLSNGKWSRIQGRCIRKSCRKPSVQQNAVIHGKSFLYKDIVKITCPNGSSYEMTCNKLGVWEGKVKSTC